MARARYPTDLTDRQWRRLQPLLPPSAGAGRPRSVERREIVDAILYVLRNGLTWRALPHDFPPWQTVYHYFRLWRLDGTWEAIHDALRDRVRTAAGRHPSPSAAILDSQSVKTAEKGGRAATTLARRFRGASATLSSIPWD
jgi:putative transposase